MRVTLNSTIRLINPWPSNSRSNWNLEMLVFEERGKPDYPEKNLSEQGGEPTTNSRVRVSHLSSSLGSNFRISLNVNSLVYVLINLTKTNKQFEKITMGFNGLRNTAECDKQFTHLTNSITEFTLQYFL